MIGTWLPYIVIALLVIAMIVLVVVILRAGGFARLRAKDKPDAAADDRPRRASEIAPPAKLSTAIGIAMRELRVLVAGGRGPVEVPWTLAVGAGGAELAALLPPPMDAQYEISWTDEKKLSNVGTVTFRTGGVVLGFEDGLVGGPRAERRLADLLRAVERVRPDRPIDSIAIVVPWRFLAMAAADETARDAVATRGRQLYQIVLAVQQRTGWRVPVHVLLSECDRIPGFAAYATAALLRSEAPVIGWPAPKSLDSMFETGWIDEAFEALRETLLAQQFHLLMGLHDAAAVDAVLLFPGRLAEVKPALAILLTQMLQSSAYHEGFMLRGVFLTGETGAVEDHAEADEVAVAADGLVTPPAAEPPPAHPAQRLAQILFLDKIFAESRLAQPAYGERTRRHRLIRRTQITLGITILLFALGLLGIRYLNDQRMTPVRELLRNIIKIEIDVADRRAATRDPETGDCVDGAATVEAAGRRVRGADFEEKRRLSIALLDRMSELDVNHVATLLAPTSLLAHSDAHVEEAIKTSFQEVVYHAISESMATPAGIQSLIARDAADPDADSYWPTTMRNVVDYDRNYRIVRSIEKRSRTDAALVGNFAALVRYSLSEELPAGFTRNYQLYADGIAHYAVPCVASGAARNTLQGIVAARYRTTVDKVYLENGVARVVDSIGRRFTSDGGDSSPDSSDTSLEALVDEIESLAAQVAIPGRYDWIYAKSANDLPLPPVQPIEGLDVVDGDFAANLPRDSRDRAFAAAVRLREARLFDVPLLMQGTAPVAATPGADPMAAPAVPAGAPSPAPRLSPGIVDTHAYLRQLFAQSFMRATPDSAVAYAGAGWDYAQLRGTANAVKDYASFMVAPGGAMPEALHMMALAAARRHFAERIDTVIDQATPGGAGGLSDAEATAFVQALPILLALRNSLVEADAGGAATRLDARVAARAGTLLGVAERQLNDQGGPYAVDRVGLATWRGTGSLAAATFGVDSDEALVASLAPRRLRVTEAAGNRVAALLGYLRDPGTAASARDAALAARWQAILDTLKTYDLGNPNNTLVRLERFMTVDIDRLQRECAQIRAVGAGSSDYFANQQAAIAGRIGARCRAVSIAGTRTTFDALRTAFNADLAGRFPFGDAKAPPVEPGEVQRFFADYGDALEPLRAQLDATQPGSEAGAALAQLQRVRTALAPMLAGPGPLAYTVDVRFLTDPTLARGQRQIVEARLGSTPANQAKTPHGPASFTWANGQPVALSLRWALNAPSVPVEALATDDPVAARCVPPAGGGVATVRVPGNWSLLRLIAKYPPRETEDAQPSAEDGVPVAFDVPVCANLLRAPGGDDSPGPARIFLRLALSATVRTPDKPDRQVPVLLPVFPRTIPPLEPR